MAKIDKEIGTVQVTMPEGRLLFGHLVTRDAYKEGDQEQYKVTMAYEPDDLDDLQDAMIDLAIQTWGLGADDNLLMPIKDGDKVAAGKVKEGRKGDIYEGKLILNASTKFNRDGDDDEGGAMVYDEVVEVMSNMDIKKKVFNGSHGVLAVTLDTWMKTLDDGDKRYAIKAYFTAFQHTRGDAEDRIAQQSDHSSLFKPRVIEGGKAKKRAKRAG